jgi:hypothetical protein
MSKSLVSLKKLSTAESIFQNFKGLFCIYKPPDIDLIHVYNQLKTTLIKGINDLPNRDVESIVKIDDEKNLVFVDKNLADTKQASGPNFVRKNFQVDFLHALSPHDSGVVG